MQPNFIKPVFERKSKVAGVYKITFDGKYFYIGSSKNIRTRFVQWKTTMLQGINKNKRMREIVKASTNIVFEIVEITTVLECKYKEDLYIKGYWGHDFLLNKCPNAFDNLGCKFSRTERGSATGCSIGIFDMDWNFIKKFDFIIDAVRYLGCSERAISKFLKGKCQYVKGCKFKRIGKDGNYIDPPAFVSKKPPLKPKKVKNQPTPGKSVTKYDLKGNKITVYKSIGDAARSAEADKKNFVKIIKHSPINKYKGFIYKIDG